MALQIKNQVEAVRQQLPGGEHRIIDGSFLDAHGSVETLHKLNGIPEAVRWHCCLKPLFNAHHLDIRGLGLGAPLGCQARELTTPVADVLLALNQADCLKPRKDALH